ncbi:MAG: hypothetical protein MN733_18155 [Nitrososphaera sp.]|nr:hypothetical protein [Nitrososphaera sp.]
MINDFPPRYCWECDCWYGESEADLHRHPKVLDPMTGQPIKVSEEHMEEIVKTHNRFNRESGEWSGD